MTNKKEELLEKTLFNLAVLAVICLAILVFMGKSYQQSLQAMDSSIHARLALDVTGNGIIPVLPMRSLVGGANRETFNDHPFTLFYLEGWVMRSLGADAWSARLIPSLFAVGCIPLVFWIGTLLFSPIMGLATAFTLTLSHPFISYGARFQLDHAMIFFILLSFVFWIKRKPLLLGVSVGLGMWMKNPVAFLIFPSALLSLAITRQTTWREIRRLATGFLVALGIGSTIWLITGYLGGWNLVSDYWHRQVFGTAVGGRGSTQSYDFLLFSEALKRRFWPWLPLLIMSLALIFKNRAWRNPSIALPLSATITVIVVISLMRFKFDHYYLPMYPFIALLTLDCIRPWITRHRLGVTQVILVLGLILPSALLAMPIELAPEMFPALTRFEAIIQSYGTCQDKVAYIEGNQPYGSFGDYRAEISFYTNRAFLGAQCPEAAELISKEHPDWILIFGENHKKCLTDEQKRNYPTTFKFGNQYLLSRRKISETEIDITPLARTLQAPLDCNAVPLPKNRYYKYD